MPVTQTLTGLPPGTQIDVRVIAFNAAGQGPPSLTQTMSTTGGAPPTPTPTPTSSPRQSLLTYLNNISGNHVLSGQVSHADSSEFDADTNVLGFPVAIAVYDPYLVQWANNYIFDVSFLNRALQHAAAGGIIGLELNIPNPAGNGSSQDGNTPNADQILTPGTAQYNALIGFLDQSAPTVQAVKDAGRAALMRIMWELDGGWFWWGNANLGSFGVFTPAKQVQLYRMIRNYYDAKGFDHLVWQWSVNGGPGSWSDTTQSYPGDAFVDVVGMDAYTNTLAATYTTLYNNLRSLAPSKPIALAEWGSGTPSANNPSFNVQNLVNDIKNSLPRICFMNAWSGWGWSLDTNPVGGLSDPYVINRNQVVLPPSGGTPTPTPTPTPSGASPDRTRITPGSGSITDNQGNVYTLVVSTAFPPGTAMKNGSAIDGGGGTSAMEWYNGQIYGQDGNSGSWYILTGGNTWVGPQTAPPAPDATPTSTPTPTPAPSGSRVAADIPFSENSVWNVGLSVNAAWAAVSDADMQTLRSLSTFQVQAANFGQPIFYGGPSDPEVLCTCQGKGPLGNTPWSQLMHVPLAATPAVGTDKQMNLFDSTRPDIAISMGFCTLDNGVDVRGGISSVLGSVMDVRLNGIAGQLDPPPQDFNGTDNYIGGVISNYDISQGVIRHMLRYAMSLDIERAPSPNYGSPQGVPWPNYHVDYYAPDVYHGNILAGQTIGIPGNVNINGMGLTTGGLMLARCLQDYGAVWRDTGGADNSRNISFYSTPENDTNPLIQGMRTDLHTIIGVCAFLRNQGPNNINGGPPYRVPLLPPIGTGSVTTKPRVTAPIVGAVSVGTWAGATISGGPALPSGQQMRYNYLLPSGYDSNVIYPILVWEHANNEGNAWYNSSNRTDYLASGVANQWFNNTEFRRAYPCIVVLPYCDQTTDTTGGATQNFGGWVPPGDAGPNFLSVARVVAAIAAAFSTDSSRYYIMGDSLGGHGTWTMMIRYNRINGDLGQLFTAGMPFAGVYEVNGYGSGPNADNIAKLRTVPVWAISGAQDGTSIPAHWPRPLWTAYAGNTNYPAQPGGGQAGTSAFRYTEVTDLGHDVSAYHVIPAATPMLDWLFSKII